MTSLFHAHDADGAPPATVHRTAVHVRGGIGASRIDLDEIEHLAQTLDRLRAETGHLESALHAAGSSSALDATWHPVSARAAQDALEEAISGWWGVRRLSEEVFELAVAARYAWQLYTEAESAARFQTPAPSFVGSLWALLHIHQAPGTVLGSVLLVGRLPGVDRSSIRGRLLTLIPDLVNFLHGDDSLPPDAIALDRAVRELAEHGQHAYPWFLLPRTFTIDGRTIEPDELTAAQRLAFPMVQMFHTVTGWEPGRLEVAVAPQETVAPAGTLPQAVRALHAIHRSQDVTGTLEIRRTDHPDGRRSWTVLLPSTQAMVPGSRNPVDNLTNVEAYIGQITDVELGAARAMELAGIAPGEEVAVLGFSQGGLTAMRLAADPLVRTRYNITTVVTAGSPVGHLPTPAGTEVLHLEHMEDPILGLDGTSNPAEPSRTTVSRSLATGTAGELRFDVAPGESHSVEAYARTAELALSAAEPSVLHLQDRLTAITGPPGATVTATAYTLTREG